MSEIDRLLERARAHLTRLEPREAAAAAADGALLVDIRPESLRDATGTIPNAIVIDRNVLEWRLDPTSPHRITDVENADRTVILLCDEGYASSLAAATLQELGLHNATDVVGGYRAWVAGGLPVRR
jgi:rhodanese-related sulfurtransferase